MQARLIPFLLVSVLVASSSIAADIPPAMALLRSSYESNLQATVRYDAAADGMATYSKKLDSMAETLKNAGDLEGVVAIRAEKKRFEEEKKVPAGSAPDINPAIARARAGYQQSVTKGEIDKNKGILALAANYASALEALKKQLTKEDMIEEATLVKQEIDRLRASAEVTSAQFVIADLASKSPQTTAQPKKTTQSTPAVPRVTAPKPVEYMRRIYCKGGTDHTWTEVVKSIGEGDIVRITAKGKWRCTGLEESCDPEGYPGGGTGTYPKLHSVRRYTGHGSYLAQENRAVRYGYNRHMQRKPYGALVCKVGETGQAKFVGDSLCFTNKEEGPLYMDANVADGDGAREGCSGSLSVTVAIQKASQ